MVTTFFFLVGLGFAKQALYCLSHTSSPFCCGYFTDGVSGTVCLDLSGTAILLLSASQVVRITGVSHCAPLLFQF
jgi:hypothetical protein